MDKVGIDDVRARMSVVLDEVVTLVGMTPNTVVKGLPRLHTSNQVPRGNMKITHSMVRRMKRLPNLLTGTCGNEDGQEQDRRQKLTLFEGKERGWKALEWYLLQVLY